MKKNTSVVKSQSSLYAVKEIQECVFQNVLLGFVFK